MQRRAGLSGAGVALAPLLFASCSLLYDTSGSDSGGGTSSEICKGSMRTYSRGAAIGEFLYQHVDYSLGTLTFWAERLESETASPATLVDLAGIRVVASGENNIEVEFPDAEPLVFDGAVEWPQGQPVFIALRWDANHTLTGDYDTDRHSMLRVGSERYLGHEELEAVVASGDAIEVGAEGRFHVDQLVVYDRPFYVPNDTADTESDELFAAATRTPEGPRLPTAPNPPSAVGSWTACRSACRRCGSSWRR